MTIRQYVNLTVWKITREVDDYGNNKQVLSDPVATGGYYGDNKNTINIESNERVYIDSISLRLRLTPMVYAMAMNPSGYSIEFRGEQWRVNDNVESGDRMSIEFTCYRNAPETST